VIFHCIPSLSVTIAPTIALVASAAVKFIVAVAFASAASQAVLLPPGSVVQ
jgi:hypothetical protein